MDPDGNVLKPKVAWTPQLVFSDDSVAERRGHSKRGAAVLVPHRSRLAASRGSRIAAGNADARSARQQKKRARRNIDTSGARRTGGSGIGEQMLMAKATRA